MAEGLSIRGRVSSIPIPVRLIGGLAGFLLAGALVLMLPVMGASSPLNFTEAIFTASSALTVTGLSLFNPAERLSFAGQITLAALVQIGGIGYMVLAVAAFRLIGRRVVLADRLALQDALGLLSPSGIVQLARQILLTVVIIEALGAILLFINWRDLSDPGTVAWMAVFHSITSFCNAGFEIFSGNPAFPAGFPTDTASLTIKSCLIFLGGIGIPVLYELVTWRGRTRFSLHTRLTLIVSLILILWGGLGIYLGEAYRQGVLSGEPLDRQVLLSLFQSISCRTAGFAGLPNFVEMNASTQLMIVTLMFVGGAPASVGGGVTTGTLLVLVLALWSYGRGEDTPIIGGRAIPGAMVRKAAAVLTVSLLAVLTATYVILLTHPHLTLDQVVFEVVSAFATCGLTLASTTQLNGFGLAVIVFIMFWGRLGPLSMLYLFTQARPPRRVRYPEEKVLLG